MPAVFFPKYPLILAGKHLLENYEDWVSRFDPIANSLSNSNLSRGKHLEKLETSNTSNSLFSIRLSIKSRLLLTRVQFENGFYWLMLDCLENHEYHKSPFLNSVYLKAYIHEQLDNFLPGMIPRKIEEVTVDGLPVTNLSFYKNQFLELSITQDEVVDAKAPLIVNGMPGSGKSTLAARKMEQFHLMNSPLPALYLCKSKFLRDEMELNLRTSPVYNELYESRCVYKTYMQLLQEKFPDHEFISDGYSYFFEWFEDLPKTLKQKCKVELEENEILTEKIFQIFRSISGLPEAEWDRFCHQPIRDLFSKYLNYLSSKSVLDPTFYEWSDAYAGVFAEVIVDESQDFSTCELRQIAKLCTDKQILFFMDSNQSLKDNFSKYLFLKQILNNKASVISLTDSWRCSKLIAQVCNSILDLKHFLTGGKLDKQAYSLFTAAEDAEAGSIEWLETISEQLRNEVNNSARIAVICTAENKELALKDFPTAIVLTIEECKGLEFDKIIIYQLLNQKSFLKTDKLLKEYQSSNNNIGRALRESAQHHYGPFFNNLFTAFSRARKDLVIYYKNGSENRNLIRIIKNSIVKLEEQNPLNTPQAYAESTEEEWDTQLKKLSGKFNTFALEKAHINSKAEMLTTLIPSANLKPLAVSVDEKKSYKSELVSSKKLVETKKTVNESDPKNAAEKYIDGFIKQIKYFDKNFINLLKNKNFEKYLYSTPLNIGSQKYDNLASWIVLLPIFDNFVKKIQNLLDIDPDSREYLTHLLSFFAYHPQTWTDLGQSFIFKNYVFTQDSVPLQKLINNDNNNQLAKIFNFEFMFLQHKDEFGFNIAEKCLTFSNGIKFFRHLLHNNKSWVKDIFLKSTPTCIANLAFEHFNLKDESVEILQFLVENNNKLVNKITAEDFYYQNEQGISVFLVMLSDSKYHQTLQIIFLNLNILISEDIPYLFNSYSNPNGNTQIPIFELLSCNSGFQILEKMITNNFFLIKQFSIDNLLYPLKFGTNTLFLLSLNSVGQNILKIIIEHRLGLLDDFSLFELTKNINGKNILYNLTLHEQGIYILKLLLKNNNLMNLSNIDLVNDKLSVLGNLSTSAKGRKFLVQLFKKIPDLANELSSETLYSLIPNSSLSTSLNTIIDCLNQDSNGRKILECFKSNPKLSAVIEVYFNISKYNQNRFFLPDTDSKEPLAETENFHKINLSG